MSARMSTPSSATWPTWPSSRPANRPRPTVRERALDAAEERILDILIPPPRGEEGGKRSADQPESAARQAFRKKLREGQLDTREIEIDLSQSSQQLEIMGPAGMEEMTEQLRGMFGQMGQQKRQTRKLPIAEALKLVQDEEAAKLVNEDDIKTQALLCGRAERHRVHRRDRQGHLALRRQQCRRGVAPGRAARPAAAGRGHDRVDQVRHDQDRPHPVHRLGCVSPEQAQRPDPGAAGPFPDPGRTAVAVGAGFRIHPDPDPCVAGQAVPGPAGHRKRDDRLHAATA